MVAPSCDPEILKLTWGSNSLAAWRKQSTIFQQSWFGGADLHSSYFTLSCKLPWCVIEVKACVSGIDPLLWSWALGCDWKNEIMDTSGQSESVRRVSGFTLRCRMRSLDVWRELGVELLLLLIRWGGSGCFNAYLGRRSRHVQLWRDHGAEPESYLAWEHTWTHEEELEDVVTSLNLLPSQPRPW